MERITERTVVPITLVGSVIGVAAWITMVYAKGENTSVRVDKVEVRMDSIEDRVDRKMDLIIDLLQREKK
jgi:hypothetical protein